MTSPARWRISSKGSSSRRLISLGTSSRSSRTPRSSGGHRRCPMTTSSQQIEERGRALLAANGFARYEISAYARAGRRCVHNVNYWQFGDYLRRRRGRSRQDHAPRNERDRAPCQDAQSAHLCATSGHRGRRQGGAHREPEADALEFLMNALRLVDGTRVETSSRAPGQAGRHLERGSQRRRRARLVGCRSRHFAGYAARARDG